MTRFVPSIEERSKCICRCSWLNLPDRPHFCPCFVGTPATLQQSNVFVEFVYFQKVNDKGCLFLCDVSPKPAAVLRCPYLV